MDLRKIFALVIGCAVGAALCLAGPAVWAQQPAPHPGHPAALEPPSPFPELDQEANALFYRNPVTWTGEDISQWHFDYYWRKANRGVLLPSVPRRQLSMGEMQDPVGHNLVAESNRDHVRSVESILCLNNTGRVALRPFTAACILPNGQLFAVSNFPCDAEGNFDLARIWPRDCRGHRIYTHETRTVTVREDPVVATDDVYQGYQILLQTRVHTLEQYLHLRQRMLARLHYVPPVSPQVYANFIRSETERLSQLQTDLIQQTRDTTPPRIIVRDNPRIRQQLTQSQLWLYRSLIGVVILFILGCIFSSLFFRNARALNLVKAENEALRQGVKELTDERDSWRKQNTEAICKLDQTEESLRLERTAKRTLDERFEANRLSFDRVNREQANLAVYARFYTNIAGARPEWNKMPVPELESRILRELGGVKTKDAKIKSLARQYDEMNREVADLKGVLLFRERQVYDGLQGLNQLIDQLMVYGEPFKGFCHAAERLGVMFRGLPPPTVRHTLQPPAIGMPSRLGDPLLQPAGASEPEQKSGVQPLPNIAGNPAAEGFWDSEPVLGDSVEVDVNLEPAKGG